MSTNRILRPRSGSIDARPPVIAKPIVVRTKPTEGQTTVTSGAAGTSGIGMATAAMAPQQSMERLVERLENELSLLRAQLMEQAEQFRKDIATMQEHHRKEISINNAPGGDAIECEENSLTPVRRGVMVAQPD
uniref:Uncharacterized protein n=1 Tax=Anopheles coluzzii TaxID=1518534 RepID=A0A8W7P2H9_ANOCL